MVKRVLQCIMVHQETNNLIQCMVGIYIYYPESDVFQVGNRMDRKTARILSKIAMTINPETKYKSGTQDFKIID